MTKAEVLKYIKGDDDSKRKSIDLDELNKDYKNQDLDNPAYQEFWKEIPRRKSTSVTRPSSKDKKEEQLATPERKRREVREKYLPEINKNTWVRKKEIDLTTLYEDPLFDPSRRPKRNLRGGKMSVDGRMGVV